MAIFGWFQFTLYNSTKINLCYATGNKWLLSTINDEWMQFLEFDKEQSMYNGELL